MGSDAMSSLAGARALPLELPELEAKFEACRAGAAPAQGMTPGPEVGEISWTLVLYFHEGRRRLNSGQALRSRPRRARAAKGAAKAVRLPRKAG